MTVTNKTILFEGCHKVGKSTAIGLLCKRTQYAHTLIDRGWASNWAFGRIYDREETDLDQAIHDYFANPTAYVVYFMLWASDYQEDFKSESFDRASWVGHCTDQEDNRLLDTYIHHAVFRAIRLGYKSRILVCTARTTAPESQVSQILNFIEGKDYAAN